MFKISWILFSLLLSLSFFLSLSPFPFSSLVNCIPNDNPASEINRHIGSFLFVSRRDVFDKTIIASRCSRLSERMASMHCQGSLRSVERNLPPNEHTPIALAHASLLLCTYFVLLTTRIRFALIDQGEHNDLGRGASRDHA